jgi:glycine zipper 2TM protein
MKRLILVLMGLSVLSGCSNRKEQRVSTNSTSSAPAPDLTLPDTSQARDTSTTTSARANQPVSALEQPASRTEAAKPRPGSPQHRQQRVAPKHSRATSDTSVKAYAPTLATARSRPTAARTDTATTAPADSSPAVPRDTATSRRDTTIAPRRDTSNAVRDTLASRRDTAPTSRSDSTTAAEVARTERNRDSTPKADTANTPRPDMASTPKADTATSKRDTVKTPAETTSTRADSSNAPSPSMATVPPSTAPAGNAAGRTLAVGTQIHAALDDSITSRRDTVGQRVSGHVMENVTGPGGHTLIAAGTPVQFTITRIRPSRSKSSQGRLALQADGVSLNGQLLPVQAEIKPVPRELRGRGVTGSDAAKVGGGAAAGAVLGGVVGGNTKGAVIGGVAGAAAGAVVANQTATRDVVVKAKTPVVMVLTAPLVTP